MFTKFYRSSAIVLRKVAGRAEAFFQGSTHAAGGANAVALNEVLPGTGFLALAVIGLLAIVAVLAFMSGSVLEGVALATAAPALRDLKTVLAELKSVQDANRGKVMSESDAAKFDALAKEAKAIQDEFDREAQLTGLAKAADDMEKKRREVAGGAMIPGDGVHRDGVDEVKAEPIAGYMTLGDYVTAQKSLDEFNAMGRPEIRHVLAKLAGLARARTMFAKSSDPSRHVVPVTVAEYKAMRQAAQSARGTKAVPTLGDQVIEPTRLADMVRVDEHETLRIRDVLNIGRTNSNAVEYMRLTGYTRAAAATAHGAQKPEAALTMDVQTAIVRTIAAWIPVNNQQLEDMPALAGIINTELLYDLDRHVEELVTYGDGVGQNFEGIVTNASVLTGREEAGDTLIDRIRRMITDVRRDGYMPNGVLIDPLDWESIVLTKGSDNHYIWIVVTDENGSRIWGINVVESTAATDVLTGARNVIVGDWMRGATLWDRMDSTIAVGWQNDQFIRNQRTILAELRAAFAVRRPRAFRKYETAAGGS